MSKKCRNTPIDIARQLRREANFGCARCGHPLLDNAHIIPYSQTKNFKVEDMVALCPRCHRVVDGEKYPESELRKIKANPRNTGHIDESEAFLIKNNDLIVNLGGAKFTNTPRVLVCGDYDLISVRKGVEGDVLLSVNFFNKNNDLVAQISENFWTANTDSLWDLVYKPGELTIWNDRKDISLGVKIENGEIFLRGTFYCNGFPVHATPEKVTIGGNRFFAFSMRNGQIGIKL